MKNNDVTVFVVDDDEAVRKSLCVLVRAIGLKAEGYATAVEFLEHYDPEDPGCLVLDVRMPGMSGLELQRRLRDTGSCLPIIFLTGIREVPVAVEAMREGAVDFLEKPFQDQDLLDRIQRAIELDSRRRRELQHKREIEERLSQLTAREREVMEHVVHGEANRAIAACLRISERTVELHRSRVMKKMQAGSLAELVSMVLRAES